MTTKVLPCDCRHEFQDRRYGRGQRLHNYSKKLFSGQGGYRCTICLATKQDQEAKRKAEQQAKKKEKEEAERQMATASRAKLPERIKEKNLKRITRRN